MPALAKTSKSIAGAFNVRRVEGNNIEAERGQQPIEVAAARRTLSGLGHHRDLKIVRRRHLGAVGRQYRRREFRFLGLVQQSGNERRTIDDDQSNMPLSL